VVFGGRVTPALFFPKSRFTEVRCYMGETSKGLRDAAAEIRAENHSGWGNLCEQAADELDAMEASARFDRELVARLRDDLADARLGCSHDGWAKCRKCGAALERTTDY
jgi:hypothetical protein